MGLYNLVLCCVLLLGLNFQCVMCVGVSGSVSKCVSFLNYVCMSTLMYSDIYCTVGRLLCLGNMGVFWLYLCVIKGYIWTHDDFGIRPILGLLYGWKRYRWGLPVCKRQSTCTWYMRFMKYVWCLEDICGHTQGDVMNALGNRKMCVMAWGQYFKKLVYGKRIILLNM